MIAFRLRVALSLAVVLAACDRPAPLNAPRRPGTAGEGGLPTARVVPRARAARVPAAELVAGYLATTDLNDRRRLLYELHDVSGAEGVAALDRLLRVESVPELQTELFDSLAIYDGAVDAKLAILRLALVEHPLAGEPRDAAIDALLEIQDPRAIPVWEALRGTGGDELSDLAASTIAELRALPVADEPASGR